jgi:hypothetical protein
MYDLWTEASRDLTAENEQRALEMAKHSSQGLWAFLAQAGDHLEYSDRLELTRDRLEAVASATGAPVEKLLEVFDQRFALLMQAKGDGNPFGDDDSDSDNKDEDGDGSTDDDGDDSDQGDETDQGGDDDSSDDSDTSEDSDDDDDDQGDGPDEDDPDGDDKDADSAPPFMKGSSRYASLLARIEAGENPLSWGGTPFARSSARVTAAGANDDFVSDANVPNPTEPANGLMGAPGPMPSLPETTKPRQLPEGSGGGFPDPSGMFGEETDPALNGGDIGAGADDLPPADSAKAAKVRAIAADVQATNPGLSPRQCERVARQVVARYYKQAEDLSPLLYGDRGNVPDGPFTKKVKEYEPKPPKMKAPGGGGAPAAAGEEAAAAGAGAGEAAALAEGAEALAPLLLL